MPVQNSEANSTAQHSAPKPNGKELKNVLLCIWCSCKTKQISGNSSANLFSIWVPSTKT